VGALVAPAVLSRLTLDPAPSPAYRASVASPTAGAALSTSALNTPSQWLTSLVPSNPIGAAVG
jgi:hypothetical protein